MPEKYVETVIKTVPNSKDLNQTTQKISDGLSGKQVYVKVTHCGLCHTDLHLVGGKTEMVLGHEPVGVVEELGPDCTKLKKGDVVGWGYLHNSCGECEYCWTGREVLCPKREMYGYADLNFGGFGTGAILRENFLYKIPEGLSPSDAAVLQCAGATVFSALYNNNVRPTDRVGVVGIGGLGHLALQFANKMGCHVTAFSGSENKKEEAMSFGAHEFTVTKVPEGEKFKVEEKLDIILSTVSGQLDWSKYYEVLKPSGTVVAMGLSDDPICKLPYASLLMNEQKLTGSLVASRQVQTLMLEFAARHKITVAKEELEMTKENLETCFERLEKGDVRYRFVLKNGIDKAESAKI